MPSARYYILNSLCNISSAVYQNTISSSTYSVNFYAQQEIPTANINYYTVWNLSVTASQSGTYLIGVNNEYGIRLTINGVVYSNNIYDPYDYYLQSSLLYNMAASVSLIKGVTYPIILEHCSYSCSNCNYLQLLTTLPNANTSTLLPVFTTTQPVGIVPSLSNFLKFNLNTPIINTTVLQNNVSANSIAPSNPLAMGNPQTTCPAVPWTLVNGTCAACATYSWNVTGVYTFVPTSQCTNAWVQIWGASGQDGRVNYKGGYFAQIGQPGVAHGGPGGYTSAVINLVANAVYTVIVGIGGNSFVSGGNSGTENTQFVGSFGCDIGTASGGGFSALQLTGQTLLMAGGGGGGGSLTNGGSGGGLIGGNSSGLYSGTGGNTITQQNGQTTGGLRFSPYYSYSLTEGCIGCNYGQFIYAGGGGGLYIGGNGGNSACFSPQTINTTLLSFWGAGGGSGTMCGTFNGVPTTQYGITLNGDDERIPRPSPYYPGAAFPKQLVKNLGNDGSVQITCLNQVSSTTTFTNVATTPQQVFGPINDPTVPVNTCPPYAPMTTSNPVCQPILAPVVTATPIICPSNNTYYVSAFLGNDNTNTGLSPSSPFQSINPINTLMHNTVIQPGDTVFFCKGDVYMRQTATIQTFSVNPNVALFPTCSVRFSSYTCSTSTSDLLPFFTVGSVLPQTPLIGWQPIPWTLYNGTTITVLMYNFTLLDQLAGVASYLPDYNHRRYEGLQNVWVNSFTYVPARHPNTVDNSVYDYNHQYGTTIYEWMHTDPNDYLTSQNCYTPPNTRIAPGSFCNHIWNDLFGQNTTYMNSVLQNAHFFDNTFVFSDGIQGYSTITYQLLAGGYVLNGSTTFDCQKWYNLVVAPYFPSNITWGNPIFDALPVPYYTNNQVPRAYLTGYTSQFVECDGDRGGLGFPPGSPTSVKNLSQPVAGEIAYAYNNAFILSNHFAFLDRPGEFWYNITADCVYIVPLNMEHQNLLLTTYNTYPLSKVSQIVNQGMGTNFNLATIFFNYNDVDTVFSESNVNSPANIIEIDSLEFGFGGTAFQMYYNSAVFHHNIVRGMSYAISMQLGQVSIVTNNIVYNTTTNNNNNQAKCIFAEANYVMVINNTCANMPTFYTLQTNGPDLELVRGNIVLNAGCVAISMSGGNTINVVRGVVQPTTAEFNWVDGSLQMCAQWAALQSNEGIVRYNEITNIQSGNWPFLHLASYTYPVSQSEGITTIRSNEIVDNNIVINSSGNGIHTYRDNAGVGFTTLSNNLMINAEYYSDTFTLFHIGNNQYIMTANVLPDQPGPYPYMFQAQVNVGNSVGSANFNQQTSVCNGLFDFFGNQNDMLSAYTNGNLKEGTSGSIDGNMPPLVPSALYQQVDTHPLEYVGSNEDLITQYNIGWYNSVNIALNQAQMTWGGQNCSYYATQQLNLKRAQNCQARANSEPGVWQQIYSFYPNYHPLTGMCWPPTVDRVNSA